jgi:acyl-CoA thioesterase-1
MNWLVYHIASGHAFFSGVALIIVAAVASTGSTPITKRLAVFSFLIGAIAIAISSTAIPYWYYTVAIVITTSWLVSAYLENWRRWTRISVIVAWAIAAAIELPYHIMPTLVPASSRSMTVIGDSVTAGMGASDKSVRWPTLLAKEHNLNIQDISHPGETAASALKRTQSQQIVSPVLILEIGGNDLLGDTTSAQFSRDLDTLLASVCTPGRQVIMFELPLPPFRNEYGRIQRSLARKHDVALVPKRVFLSVLAANDSTVDTIHLTQAGHHRMAATVWKLVRSAFPAIAEPHGKVGVTTVAAVRALGGDVVRTSGRSPHHAALTGLSPEEMSALLTPTIQNPAGND